MIIFNKFISNIYKFRSTLICKFFGHKTEETLYTTLTYKEGIREFSSILTISCCRSIYCNFSEEKEFIQINISKNSKESLNNVISRINSKNSRVVIESGDHEINNLTVNPYIVINNESSLSCDNATFNRFVTLEPND